jgi:hypothetical protein
LVRVVSQDALLPLATLFTCSTSIAAMTETIAAQLMSSVPPLIIEVVDCMHHMNTSEKPGAASAI